MKIFDLHADIGCDVLNKHQKGEKDVLKRYHIEKCLKGEVEAICMASFFHDQSWEEMQEMILTLEKELNEQEVFHRVLTKEDLFVNKPLALMSVEGMCGITQDPEECVQWMYDHGIRLASLCWNEENALASGVGGNPDHGLSELGKRVIAKMDELHMIIDISHANPKTAADILNTAKGLVIATHSNAWNLCPHRRNLTDEQIKTIASRKGLIGMNACAYFINEDLSLADCDHLAMHAKYIKELVGIDSLACGFDFMDFFEDHQESDVLHLESADKAQNFVASLRKQGFHEEEIKKICHQNVIDRFAEYLF